MSQLKKVFLKLALVKTGANTKNTRDLVSRYKRLNLEKSLKKGYEEMAFINLSLAEMSIEADNDAMQQYEEKLTECE